MQKISLLSPFIFMFFLCKDYWDYLGSKKIFFSPFPLQFQKDSISLPLLTTMKYHSVG